LFFDLSIYLVFDVGGTAGGDEDPSQLATAHGGGDVQGRVSVLVFWTRRIDSFQLRNWDDLKKKF
jgi:hypothetical protein